MRSIRSMTPWCSCVPRPRLPMKPEAWHSSIMTRASYLSARSQISGSLAMSPSIEKTPSVAMTLKRAPCSLARFSAASRPNVSLPRSFVWMSSDMSEWR